MSVVATVWYLSEVKREGSVCQEWGRYDKWPMWGSVCQEWELCDIYLKYNAWGSGCQEWGRYDKWPMWGSVCQEWELCVISIWSKMREAKYVSSSDCVISIWSITREPQDVRSGDCVISIWSTKIDITREAQDFRSGEGMKKGLQYVRLSMQEWERYDNWPALCEARYVRSGDRMISEV